MPSCKLAALNYRIFFFPHSTRKMMEISPGPKWMQAEEHQPESAATTRGRVGTDEPILIGSVEPSSVSAAGDRSSLSRHTSHRTSSTAQKMTAYSLYTNSSPLLLILIACLFHLLHC